MTAELDDQDKKSEKNIEEAKSEEKEKDKSPDEIPQNGGGNDLKQVSEEKTAGDETEATDNEANQDDEVVAVAPRRRMPRFWERLFHRRQATTKQDVEAGTELLAKETKDAKAEIKEEEAKNEKNESGTDVTIPITDENNTTDSNKKPKEGEDGKRPRAYWRHVAIALIAIILVLVVVSVISVITSAGRLSRGPLGEPLVITECGPAKGYTEDGIYVFKGLPYALPPVGEYRWKPPMAASSLNDCWTGTYEAYNSSAYCMQKPIPGMDIEMSEDCLYLDVVTPSLSPPILRPVVVYIPGDHPLQGHSADDIKWRPTPALADAKDITFVTINYRTNVFGFLTLDLLTKSQRPPTSGNYGIMDMLAALKWVQRNIRSFGGDPEKVTVLAHGGAATASLALLSTKKSDGLFSQMWLTAPSAHFSNKTLEQVGEDNAVFLRKLNCDSLSCIRNKTADSVLSAMPGFWASDWSTDLPSRPSAEEEQSPVMTVVDGVVLYNTPFDMWMSGDIQHVPVVIGTAAQESGSSKILPDLDTWNWTDFSDYVSEKLSTIGPNVTAAALQFYIQNSSTPLQQFHTMVSDLRTICPIERLTDMLGDILPSEYSFWYVVDYKPSTKIQFSNESAAVRLSVHGIDVAAIFGLLDQYITPMASSDETFQKNMQDLFYSFVRKGRPEIRGEQMMSAKFINMIGDRVHSKMTPYENCHLWNNEVFYPTFAKMN